MSRLGFSRYDYSVKSFSGYLRSCNVCINFFILTRYMVRFRLCPIALKFKIISEAIFNERKIAAFLNNG